MGNKCVCSILLVDLVVRDLRVPDLAFQNCFLAAVVVDLPAFVFCRHLFFQQMKKINGRKSEVEERYTAATVPVEVVATCDGCGGQNGFRHPVAGIHFPVSGVPETLAACMYGWRPVTVIKDGGGSSQIWVPAARFAGSRLVTGFWWPEMNGQGLMAAGGLRFQVVVVNDDDVWEWSPEMELNFFKIKNSGDGGRNCLSGGVAVAWRLQTSLQRSILICLCPNFLNEAGFGLIWFVIWASFFLGC